MIEIEQQLLPILLPTTISATVALIIFSFTQWLQSRRSSITHLTTKLEELYLVVNELATANPVRYEKMLLILNGYETHLEDPEHVSKLLLADLDRRIKMYVELYFPDLIATHLKLFHSHEPMSDMVKQVLDEEGEIGFDGEALADALMHYDSHIRSLEKEIIANKKKLVGNVGWIGLYKRFPVRKLDTTCQHTHI